MLILSSIMEQQWFQIILGAVATGLASLIAYAFTLFISWLKTKVKSEKLRNILEEVIQAVETAVNDTTQTFVEQLKKDGKFDKDKQKEALEKSLLLSYTLLKEETKKAITKEYGDLETFIKAQIESIIHQEVNTFN